MTTALLVAVWVGIVVAVILLVTELRSGGDNGRDLEVLDAVVPADGGWFVIDPDGTVSRVDV